MSSLILRPATIEDAALLREWRNDPVTRAASGSTHEVTAEEHGAWLERALASDDRMLFVGEVEGSPAGQVRFDRLPEGGWEISVSLDASMRGRGLGSALIEAGVAELGDEPVLAHVREQNSASLGAFERAGFVTVDSERAGFRALRRG